jgi:O-acetyl-ADP-ribose deacetylase (regulator of RNase III)
MHWGGPADVRGPCRLLHFGHVGFLKSLKKQPGDVVVLPLEDRYAFYLVTKPLTTGRRPYLEDCASSSNVLAKRCAELGVETLAMPRIGSGLDHLLWEKCKQIITNAFLGVQTQVLIYERPDERREYAEVTAFGAAQSRNHSFPDVTMRMRGGALTLQR